MGSQFALARYDVYGNLDSSFHHDGKVLTRFGELDTRGRALAIDELKNKKIKGSVPFNSWQDGASGSKKGY